MILARFPDPIAYLHLPSVPDFVSKHGFFHTRPTFTHLLTLLSPCSCSPPQFRMPKPPSRPKKTIPKRAEGPAPNGAHPPPNQTPTGTWRARARAKERAHQMKNRKWARVGGHRVLDLSTDTVTLGLWDSGTWEFWRCSSSAAQRRRAVSTTRVG